MRKYMSRIVLASLLLIGVPIAHAGNHFSVDSSANYSSGTYGSGITTDIWSAPFTAAYRSDRWTLTLSVPYVDIHGSGSVIPGTGPVDNSNPLGRGLGDLLGGGSTSGSRTSTAATSASGFGDVVASAGYTLLSSSDRSFALDLGGKVKFATADVNKGLGTGENDYGVSLDTYKVMGRWTPFGGLGWMNYGSSPYIKLKNGMNANAGVNYRIESSDSVGVYYNYRQRIAAGGPTQSEVTAFWNHQLNDSLRVQSHALGGLTNGSPDWGVGASIDYSF